jgi:iron complex outermembrane receptor protein
MSGQAFAAEKTFNIPSQDLGTAITMFARQSGLRIVAPASRSESSRSRAIAGVYEQRDALRMLIEGTGLEVASDAGNVVVLRRGKGADQSDASSGQDEIVVTGRAQQLYRVAHAESGRLATPPLESSLNIQTINKQLIEDQGARIGQDLYRNFSGISMYSYSVVTARGFKQEENFFDGLRGDPYVGLSVPQLFNVERVEYLKGPAGMLYGPAAPGGILNYITKKPTELFSARATAIGGTRDRVGGSLELGGLLSSVDGAPGTRLGVFYESMDLPRNNANSRTFIVDGGLSFNLGSAAKLVLQGTHYSQAMGGNRLRGIPTDDQGNFLGSRRWNTNEKVDGTKLNSNAFQAKLDWDVASNFSMDAAARYSRGTEASNYHEPDRLRDTDGDGNADLVSRRYRKTFRLIENAAVNMNGKLTYSLGDIEGRLLGGLDYYWTMQDYTKRWEARGGFSEAAGLPAPISLKNPQYGVSDPSKYTLTNIGGTITSRSQFGSYLLNELKLGRFILTGGLRADWFTDKISKGGVPSFSGNAITYRLGGVYRITDEISAYAQMANSFEPQSIGSQSPDFGGPFAPSKGKIVEGGIKTALFNGRVQSTAAVYQIKKTNVLQADPNGGPDDLIAFGEVTSEGAEFDVSADLTKFWVVTANYAFNNARVTQDAGGGDVDASVNNRFANAPRHKLGFWSRYQFGHSGFSTALGGDLVGKRQSEAGQLVKGYAVFDASIIYEKGPWKALLRIDNLFDKTYAVSGFRLNTGHFPGAPRSAFVELSRRF